VIHTLARPAANEVIPLDKEKLLDLAKDPRFIPGIYNYCDRWCERCTMTSACLVYSTLEDRSNDPASFDVRNAEFWQELQEIFQETLELIESWATENGVDLESVDADPALADLASRRAQAKNHELVQAGHRYANTVNQWFSEQFPSAGSVIENEIESEGRILDQSMQNLDEHTEDAVEIIRWYQYQIMVKLVRGLSSDDDEEAAENDWQSDSDGSVKVALIGMDRSIMAWRTMLETFPARAAGIRSTLLNLEQLRRRTEQTFPRARAFTRPGFDISPLIS
jgi:hypothetical protein